MPDEHKVPTSNAATEAEIEAILAGLSKSQQHVIRIGVTYSSAQRNRLVDKGIADPASRGAPPLPRRPHAVSRAYDLPLTELGLLIRARLER